MSHDRKQSKRCQTDWCPLYVALGVLRIGVQVCYMKIAQIKNLISNMGFPWMKTLILASLGLVAGLVLALTLTIPVS